MTFCVSKPAAGQKTFNNLIDTNESWLPEFTLVHSSNKKATYYLLPLSCYIFNNKFDYRKDRRGGSSVIYLEAFQRICYSYVICVRQVYC